MSGQRFRSLAALGGLSISLLIPLVLAGCNDDSGARAAGLSIAGDPQHGSALIGQYGCGSCHTIPGIADADGLVGPPLTRIGSRIYIAGILRNTPENMVAWLRDPQAFVPGNAMPNVGLDEQNARDVAAFLATLR
ncbi:MAG TPA: c-type cytochrome [Xanthobacteraceae bacterium]|jgi:cytochrome c1